MREERVKELEQAFTKEGLARRLAQAEEEIRQLQNTLQEVMKQYNKKVELD